MSERDKDLAAPNEELVRSRLSRRQLLKRSVAFGLSVPALGTLLAACGGDDDDGDDQPSDGPAAFDDPTATTEAPDEPEPTAEPEATEAPDDEPEATEEPDDEPEATEEPDDEPTEMGGDGVRGGTLRVTIAGDLGTFDTQAVTQSVLGHVVWHIWEHLYTYNADMEIVEELADSLEISDDGLLVTIKVREANFHNGKAMTAEDVAASIDRWRQIAGTAGDLAEITESITAVDDRTVEWTLSQPFAILRVVLARQNAGCVIFPKEIMDEIGTEPLVNSEHYIGTGTYEFVEHQPDRHILVRRFEDYVSRMEPTSGYSGYKNQYVDEIFFIPIGDEATSVAGLRAGDYHYSDNLSPIQYDALAGDDNVTVEFIPSATWGAFVFNCEDPFTGGYNNNGQLIRQAVQAALDMEEIAIGAYGEGWYRMHPSISFEGLPWETNAGGEFYNQADPDRARELLEEAGYNDEPIIWMVANDQATHYETTAIAVQQLEDAGFNMDLQIYDWATIGERRLDPTLYNMMTTRHTFRADPIQLSGIASATTYGFWGSDEIEALREDFTTQSEFEDRFQTWEEIQTLFYTQVPKMKVADTRSFHAMSARVRGWDPTVQTQAKYWNLWLEE